MLVFAFERLCVKVNNVRGDWNFAFLCVCMIGGIRGYDPLFMSQVSSTTHIDASTNSRDSNQSKKKGLAQDWWKSIAGIQDIAMS